jgi:hypothetical protein
MTRRPTKTGDRWLLPLDDGIVTQVQIDFALGLSVDADAGLHVRIEGPFQVEREGHVTHFDPERAGAVGPLADLHQAVMTEAAVLLDGGLRLSFADGRALVVPPGPSFEAFSVTGPGSGIDAFRFVSLPGGGLAEWVE